MRDVVLLAVLVLSFATVLTSHLWLVGGLAFRTRPRWRSLVALVLPPLAPIWGYQSGFRRRAGVWVVGVVVYAAARVVAGS